MVEEGGDNRPVALRLKLIGIGGVEQGARLGVARPRGFSLRNMNSAFHGMMSSRIH